MQFWFLFVLIAANIDAWKSFVCVRVIWQKTVTVHRCLLYRAPEYLPDCCMPVCEVSSCQNLRSASHGKLNIPRFRRSTFGTCRLSQSPVRRFGTHCLIRCVIWPSSLNILGGTWKRISLPWRERIWGVDISRNHTIQIHIYITYIYL